MSSITAQPVEHVQGGMPRMGRCTMAWAETSPPVANVTTAWRREDTPIPLPLLFGLVTWWNRTGARWTAWQHRAVPVIRIGIECFSKPLIKQLNAVGNPFEVERTTNKVCALVDSAAMYLQSPLLTKAIPVAARLDARRHGVSSIHRTPLQGRIVLQSRQRLPVEIHASASGMSNTSHLYTTSPNADIPVVKIDNLTDPFSTIVTMKFGEQIPDPLVAMSTLKNLGLNIIRAKFDTSDPDSRNRFYVTDRDTSEKIVKSARLEEIRLAVLECLMEFFPESTEQLNSGHQVKLKESRDPTSPLGPRRRIVVETDIEIKEHPSGTFSELYITTDDRSGLLIDVVRTLKSLNVNVVSAELDTVGLKAHQEFMVTYHGEPLNSSMQEMVRSCLQYYLSLTEIEVEESY